MGRGLTTGVVVCAFACAALALPAGAFAGTAAFEADPRPGSELDNLVYTADAGEANRLTVSFSGFFVTTPTGGMSAPGVVTFTDPAGVTAGAGCVQAGATGARCSADGEGLPSILYVIARLGDMGDTASVGTGLSARTTKVFGGEGSDFLSGGSELNGEGGADVLQSLDGAKLIAGSGPDGGDIFLGTDDDYETITYRGRSARVDVTLDGKANDGAAGEKDNVGANIDSVVGGSGDDRLVGNSRANTLLGLGGKDRLVGLGGGDRLQAGKGRTSDVLLGGRGDDDLRGNAGANRMLGGPGKDDFFGKGGNDRLNARDKSADAVRCDKGEDRAKLDRRDWIGLGCEHRTRRSGMGAVLLQTDSFLDDDAYAASFLVGCPADGPATCEGRLDVFRDGKLKSRDGFSIKRGRLGSAFTDIGEGNKVLGDVRLKLVSRDAAGKLVVQRARGHVDPPLEP